MRGSRLIWRSWDIHNARGTTPCSGLAPGRWATGVDDKTGIGSCEQLDCVMDMFCWKYRILGKGELHWMLGMRVKCDFSRHMVSLSQQSYIEDLVDHCQQ